MSGTTKDSGALLAAGAKVKVKRSRDEGCCSVNFLKCVLHIFNVVFMLAGCGVLAVGAWTLVARHRYAALLPTPTYVVVTYLLVAAGALAVPITALGCCALRRENRTTLLCYAYLLLLSFLAEAGAGALAYYYEVAVEAELQGGLRDTFVREYSAGAERAVTRAVDAVQAEFRCCGVQRFEDWRGGAWQPGAAGADVRLVPDSCCKTITPHCGRRDHPSNIHYSGCIRQLTNHVRENLIVLAAVGAGMSVVPVFGFVFSCCLYVQIKHVAD